MWSWVLHRITGATIFFFLFVHVLDTALVRVSPQAYNEVDRHLQDADRRADGGRPGRGGALPRPQRHPRHPDRLLVSTARSYQRLMLWIVVGVWLAVMIPALGVLGMHMAERFLMSEPWTPHHREGRLAPVQEQRARPPGQPGPSARAAAPERASRTSRSTPGCSCGSPASRWSFLALGHLFIMLMWDNGVYRIDFNYVAERWASPFWQIWDMALLWLARCTAPTACAPSSATTPARTSPGSG